jgi:glycosyltransferase involved in cell wall biosynthesis
MGAGVQAASGGIVLAPVRDASRSPATTAATVDATPPVTGVSIVVPVYNEEGNLRELHRRVAGAMERVGLPWELIVVDDGSRDGGWSVLREIAAADGRVKGLRHRRNFGKAQTLTTGFAAVGHDLVVTMDGDLQDDPDELSRFVEAIDGGYDLVSGWKQKRHDPLGKTLRPNSSTPRSAASPASSSTTSTAATRRIGSRWSARSVFMASCTGSRRCSPTPRGSGSASCR